MVNAMVFGERRLYERKTCFFAVGVDDDLRSFTAHIHNLSLGGVFLELEDDVKPRLGQTFMMTIPFRRQKRYLKIKGQIVRVKGTGMGVRFIKSERGRSAVLV